MGIIGYESDNGDRPEFTQAIAFLPMEKMTMIATCARTSITVRPRLPWVVSLRRGKYSDIIGRTRVHAVANAVANAFKEIDTESQYESGQGEAKVFFSHALIDLRLQPNMIVAEFDSRIEVAIARNELIKIDPSNRERYAIATVGELQIQEKEQK